MGLSYFFAYAVSRSGSIDLEPPPGTEAAEAAFLLPVAVFCSVLLMYVIWALLVGGSTRIGWCRYNIDLLTGKKPLTPRPLFAYYSIFPKAFALRFLTFALTLLWSALLIVPGIMACYRYAMAPYILAENPKLSVMDAIRQSKEMTRGKSGKLFILSVDFIGWHLIGALTFGVAELWISPYVRAARAALYLSLTGREIEIPERETPLRRIRKHFTR